MRKASSKVLFVSCVLVNIWADISLATFSYLKTHSAEQTILDSLGFLPLIFVCCIVSASSIGVFPVFHLLMGELFPSDIRSLSIGLTISSGLSFATINILTYTYFIEVKLINIDKYVSNFILKAVFWKLMEILKSWTCRENKPFDQYKGST